MLWGAESRTKCHELSESEDEIKWLRNIGPLSPKMTDHNPHDHLGTARKRTKIGKSGTFRQQENCGAKTVARQVLSDNFV